MSLMQTDTKASLETEIAPPKAASHGMPQPTPHRPAPYMTQSTQTTYTAHSADASRISTGRSRLPHHLYSTDVRTSHVDTTQGGTTRGSTAHVRIHYVHINYAGTAYELQGHYTPAYDGDTTCPPNPASFEIHSINPIIRTHTDDYHTLKLNLLDLVSTDVLLEMEGLAVGGLSVAAGASV